MHNDNPSLFMLSPSSLQLLQNTIGIRKDEDDEDDCDDGEDEKDKLGLFF